MKKIYLYAASLAIPLLAQGIELSSSQIQDQLKVYSSLDSFRTHFKQTKRLKGLNLELKSEGVLTVRRPREIVWEVSKPSPLTLKMNENQLTLIQQGDEGKKEQKWTLGSGNVDAGSKGLDRMVAWLRLDAAEIAREYHVSREASGELICRPKKEETNDPFLSLKLQLRKDGSLSKLFLNERSGDVLEISFTPPERVPGK